MNEYTDERGRTFRAWSKMLCQEKMGHRGHRWDSEHTVYGPYFCPGVSFTPDEWVQEVRDELAMTRHPEVRTYEGLAALPRGTYILTSLLWDEDKEPVILHHGSDWGLADPNDLFWWTTDGGDWISTRDRIELPEIDLPAKVLYIPLEED